MTLEASWFYWKSKIARSGIGTPSRRGKPSWKRRLAWGGPYQIQAAISSLHAQADRPEETDWRQIAALYGRLLEMNPSPVIALNQAVAVAMAEGPAHGLRLLDRLETQGALSNYTPFHVARAELLRRAGSLDKARAAYERALKLSQNEAERVLCRRRLSEIGDDVNGKQ